METNKEPEKKLSLSAQIMAGMGLGIVAGVFFSDYCAPLQIIGDAFIKLLQITILPYIIVSMILGIGGLTPTSCLLPIKKAALIFQDCMTTGFKAGMQSPNIPAGLSCGMYSGGSNSEKTLFRFYKCLLNWP